MDQSVPGLGGLGVPSEDDQTAIGEGHSRAWGVPRILCDLEQSVRGVTDRIALAL